MRLRPYWLSPALAAFTFSCADDGATNNPTTDAADATDSVDATDDTDATDATDQSDVTDATDATDDTDATDATDDSDGTDGTDDVDGTEGTDDVDVTDGIDGIDEDDATDATDATDGVILVGCEEPPQGLFELIELPGPFVLSRHLCTFTTGFVAVAPFDADSVLELTSDGSALALTRRDLLTGATKLLRTVAIEEEQTWYASGFLAVAPGGAWAALGYTLAVDGAPGELLIVDLETDAPARSIPAPGNYGAVAIDDTHVLVNGLGLGDLDEGQGLYLATVTEGGIVARHVGTDVGAYSGPIAHSGDWIVAGGFAGFGVTWPDGLEGNRAFAIRASALMDAESPVDVFLGGDEVVMDSELVGFSSEHVHGLLRNQDYVVTGVELRSWTLDAVGNFKVDAQLRLTDGSPYTALIPVGDEWALLAPGIGYTVGSLDWDPEEGECLGGCSDTATCVDGVCVTGSLPEGQNVAALEESLGENTLLEQIAVLPPFEAVRPLNKSSMLALSSESTDGGTDLVLQKLTQGQPTVEITRASAPASIFPGSYIAAGPTAVTAIGYTVIDGSGEITVFDRTKAAETQKTLKAPGNYDAVAISDTELLLNGTGLIDTTGTQGLYLYDMVAGTGVLVADNLGVNSGWVTFHGDLVLAGGFAGFGSTWPDGSEGNKVFALSLAALYAAAGSGEPVDVFETGELFMGPSNVQFTRRGELLTVDSNWETGNTTIAVHALTGGVTPTVATTWVLSEGAVYTSVREIPGTHGFLLGFSDGYSVVTR